MRTFTTGVDRVVDALREHGYQVRSGSGGKYSGQCPVHGGRDRRLEIRPGDGRAYVKCHKGCPDTDVLEAIGLTVGDLFDEPRSGASGRVVHDVDGQDSFDLATPAEAAESSPWDELRLTAHHRQILESSAITPEVAKAAGVYSITSVTQLPDEFAFYGAKAVPALAFPWKSPSGIELVQLRPDVPVVDAEGNASKYLWPAGTSSVINAVRPVEDAEVALTVEGTKQMLSAASYAPANVAVYGVAGCRSWSTGGVPLPDLEVFEGKRVVVAFDADVAGNPDVHAAAVTFSEALKAEGAVDVQYLTLPAGDKNGLDDVLASRKEARRATYLARLIEQAKAKLPPKPARKPKKEADDASYFGDDGLLVEKLYHAITARCPAALTREREVALYRGGVFHRDKTAFSGVVGEMLGDRFRPGHRAAAEEFAAGMLFNAGLFLPERCDMALLNVRNGMLDLATGTLKPHDPSYLSSAQLPIEWDPEATCPTYEEWLKDRVGDQVDDLEEVTSTMLDPSRTPTKAIFLFGPTRSGKSTYLRIMQEIAGSENMSAVTLHQLAVNRFAAANAYGKILNCAADLSSAHVDDLSIFKMMTGEDPITADRKYGGQFTFVNRALFAFSANELPTVGESSRAYVERIKPFEFPKSFAGHEDPTIEKRILAEELPGILVRWVRAWQRMTERGGYLQTSARVRKEFETRSDRVRQWVAEACTVWTATKDGKPITPGTKLPQYMATTRRDLAQAFNQWAEENNGARMGERKIIDRLLSMNGVCEVRQLPNSVRALNVSVRDSRNDIWHETAESGAETAPGGRSEAPGADTGAVTGDASAPANPQASDAAADSGGSWGSFEAQTPCTPENATRRDRTVHQDRGELGGIPHARVAGCAETAPSAPTAPEPWPPQEPTCPRCHWPYDSNNHAGNCLGASAA